MIEWMSLFGKKRRSYLVDKNDRGVKNGEVVWWIREKVSCLIWCENITPTIRHIQVDDVQLFLDPMLVVKYKESFVVLLEVDLQNSTLAPQPTLAYNKVKSNPFIESLHLPLDGPLVLLLCLLLNWCLSKCISWMFN